MSFGIGRRKIGPEWPCFIIAEAGVNHNGDLDMALRLVREAKACGADCVKFQTFKSERVATAQAPKAAYQLKLTDPAESQLAMLRKLELSSDAHRALRRACEDEQIIFLSTPYSIEDAEMLDSIGVEGFKIASGQLVETPLLEQIARFRKPMILSTGMASIFEAQVAVDALRAANLHEIALLQCTTNYPASVRDANVRAMQSLARECGVLAGYSDHTEGISACLAAVALGAVIVEKHLTLNRNLPGPDHRCSAEPAEFRELVRGIREVEAALGDGIKQPTAAELANLTGMRRSIVSQRRIRAGERVSIKDFAFKRPACGLPPDRMRELDGLVASCDIDADTHVTFAMFR